MRNIGTFLAMPYRVFEMLENTSVSFSIRLPKGLCGKIKLQICFFIRLDWIVGLCNANIDALLLNEEKAFGFTASFALFSSHLR